MLTNRDKLAMKSIFPTGKVVTKVHRLADDTVEVLYSDGWRESWRVDSFVGCSENDILAVFAHMGHFAPEKVSP